MNAWRLPRVVPLLLPLTLVALAPVASGRDARNEKRPSLIQVMSIRVASFSDHTLAYVQCDKQVEYRKGLLHDPERFYVDILNAIPSMALKLRAIRVADQFVIRIGIAETEPNVTRVAFYLKGDISDHVVPLSKSPGLLIDLEPRSGRSLRPRPPLGSVVAESQPNTREIPIDQVVEDDGNGDFEATPDPRPGRLRKWRNLATAQNGGQAEVSFRGYYEGGDTSHSNVSGIGLKFRQFISHAGFLSGSLEGYDRQGRFQNGDNYLELRGLPWAGLRWRLNAGDFRVSTNLVEFPFYNIFTPEISARGFKMEASRDGKVYSWFTGVETLLEGPRVPLRARLPQSVLGATFQQQALNKRLQYGLRFLRIWSSPESQRQNPEFFPLNRRFLTVDSFSLQSFYRLSRQVKLYGEATISATTQSEKPQAAIPLSTVAGIAWETTPVTARANYTSQSNSYLPLAGYFIGDRKGPFVELRIRPIRFIELFGSASSYSNNLEGDARVSTFKSESGAAGSTLTLPLRFTVSGELNVLRFSSFGGDVSPQNSRNRQLTFSATRPILNHNLRLSIREMSFSANGGIDRQKSEELEDSVRFKSFSVGGAVRLQSTLSAQSRNTMFYRGFGQAKIRKLTAYANIEIGKDLQNQTVFATNTFSTTYIGVNAPTIKSWSVQAEVFRNRLSTDLNPQNIFLLENRGLDVSRTLSALNQWNFFLRISRNFNWGAALPTEG